MKLLVCRLSTGKPFNVLGAISCSPTQCNCEVGYRGNKCQYCKVEEYYFASDEREGIVDDISGYGVTCHESEP